MKRLRGEIAAVIYRLRFWTWERWKEAAASFVARRLPWRVRTLVVVQAAVKAREPEWEKGDAYCGPDGLTFHDLVNAAGRR